MHLQHKMGKPFCFFFLSNRLRPLKGSPKTVPLTHFVCFGRALEAKTPKCINFSAGSLFANHLYLAFFAWGSWDMSLEFSVLMHASSDDHVSSEMRRDQNNSINSTWRTESFVFAKYNMKHHKERDFRLTPRWMFHYRHKVWYAVSTTLHPMESEWCRTGYYFGNAYAIFRHKK